MSLRKMKVVVSRTGAAAVPGEGRRMRRRPAWSAGPEAPARGEVAAHPGPPGSPEDGQQRNKKMDSLAAGELNASHQPWVPEFVAHWRKTHQEYPHSTRKCPNDHQQWRVQINCAVFLE
ncbi:uncharacterized protein LOC126956020 isoform X4 [Macaca thibetana thibetana]|uniref:uncharacterized protein LOC126956020 isoform X4 n=1 Tax=Macaca thibetana thibetana TaxID=257877 RepID=UPI0021BC387C|nr:uncharacterized protein LOC126956020 isoform X4 [Macaca thibetana thibetana]